MVNSFAKRYNCKVQVSTFNTMDEALAKIHSGQVNFDVFMGVTIDVLGPLIAQKFIQPLNHSYIPNITQAWPDFQNPFYDGKWQYTVPYTIYTTGMSWRKDHVPENPYQMANPWAMPWQSKYKGKVAILDDYREGISLGLMKNGIFNLNTTSPSQIQASGQALQNLAALTNVQINNNDYTQIPSGQVWIHHAWSGDIAAALSYMPKGVPVEVVGYWFPPDGKGPVGNDLNTVLRTATNPVLAHLFLNYLLDVHERADQHQLERVHAAAQRDHPAAPGQGADPAAEPDVHGRAALVLPAGGHGTADPGADEPALGAGLASGQQGRVAGWPCARSATAGRAGSASSTGCSGPAWPRPASSG